MQMSSKDLAGAYKSMWRRSGAKSRRRSEMGGSHKWTRQLLLVGLILLLNCTGNPLARRLRLRPLSAAEIRHLENTLPAGRSVSSGFAALTGFGLGLTKALTGVFIYDVITANITEAEESTASASGSSVREICLNAGSSSSDITCIVYYTN